MERQANSLLFVNNCSVITEHAVQKAAQSTYEQNHPESKVSSWNAAQPVPDITESDFVLSTCYDTCIRGGRG